MHDFGGLFTGTQDEQNVGLFSELSFQPNERFTSLIGIRLDAHNLFGTRVLPRAHFKYELSEGSILRASSGWVFVRHIPGLNTGSFWPLLDGSTPDNQCLSLKKDSVPRLHGTAD